MVKTALIVDDSRLARLTLKRLLSKYDIQVFEAEGVLDAEMWLSRNTLPDIVFMDIMMPELDGYEGLARLRAEPETRTLPVIMYSGDISDEARKKARDAGATGYLPKPADAGRLDHLLTALQERMRGDQTAKPASGHMPPPPPSSATAAAPPPSRPEVNLKEAAEEFGLSGHHSDTSAPAPAPAAEPQVVFEDSSEIKRRLDILEKEISDIHASLRNLEEKLTSERTSANFASEVERHHKDVVLLKTKLTDMEKQNKLALIIGGTGLFFGLVSIIWHMF